AGGHEYVLDAYDAIAGRLWMQNSWGDGWGAGGRAWLDPQEWADVLLADDGDCTVLVPLSEPAPTPSTPEQLFETAARLWLQKKRRGDNRVFEYAVETYLGSLT